MTFKAILCMRRQLAIFALAMIAYHIVFTFGMAVMPEPTSPRVLVQLTLGGPAYFACLFALVAGSNLGSERGRYAAAALLFPISRVRQSLITFAVDLAGLAAAYGFACALAIGSYALVHGPSALRDGSLAVCVIVPLASIVALYGLSAVASVSLGQGRLVGPTLAVACFIALMMSAPDVPGHHVFQWLNLINPAMFLYLASMQLLGPPPVLELYRGITLPVIIACLAALALSYLILAGFIFRGARSALKLV